MAGQATKVKQTAPICHSNFNSLGNRAVGGRNVELNAQQKAARAVEIARFFINNGNKIMDETKKAADQDKPALLAKYTEALKEYERAVAVYYNTYDGFYDTMCACASMCSKKSEQAEYDISIKLIQILRRKCDGLIRFTMAHVENLIKKLGQAEPK